MCAAVAWGSSAWVRSKVLTAVGTSPLRTASSTSVCLRTVVSCWVAGDCVSHPACCAMVWVGFQSVRVSSPLYRGHALKCSHVSSSAWLQMHLVCPAGTWIERRVYHRWYRVRRGSCSRASWSRGFCRCAGRVLGHPLRGLCGRGYRGQVLQVAVVWGVQSHAFEPWGVVGVLVFGLRVCASIAVCVAV